jgi:polyferredoxin
MLRRAFQILGTILPNSYFPVFWKKAIYQGQLKGICAPLMNCFACPLATVHCPIGALQHFVAVSKIPYYIIGYLSIIGLSVGRMACGWICPFGFFQDLIAKIKVKKRKLRFPAYLAYLRYVFLVVAVIALPLVTHEHWFSKLCPWGTIEAGIPWVIWSQDIRNMIGGLYYIKIFILVLFLGLMVFFKRPFCFLMCPLGAIFSLFNKLSILRLGVDTESCTKCNRCLRNCPVGIKVYENPNSHNCIRCLECTKCSAVRVYSIFSKNQMTRDEYAEAIWDMKE